MQYHTMDAMQYNGIICILAPKIVIFGNWGHITACWPAKRPADRPNGHLLENRRCPELPQDMRMLWSHWIRSVTDHPSEPKKGGLYGCSVRKSDFWATFGPKKKTKILCWPRCTAGLGAAAAGFSACNCLFDSHNCLLTSLILDPYYKLNWPKMASAVYWLFGTLLYPC